MVAFELVKSRSHRSASARGNNLCVFRAGLSKPLLSDGWLLGHADLDVCSE